MTHPDPLEGPPPATAPGVTAKLSLRTQKISPQEKRTTLSILVGFLQGQMAARDIAREYERQIKEMKLAEMARLAAKLDDAYTSNMRAHVLEGVVREIQKDIDALDEMNGICVSAPLTTEEEAAQYVLSRGRVFRRHCSSTEGEGGAYGEKTDRSMTRVFEVLKHYTNLCYGAGGFVDIGGGSNVMAWFAAVRYCDFAMGVEININRSLLGAYYARQLLHDDPERLRNFRVALLHGCFSTLQPLRRDTFYPFTHAYAWDRVFPDEVYLALIAWIAKSDSIEYVVSYKAMVSDFYMQQLLEGLKGAKIVTKIYGLAMVGSGEKDSAVVVKRELPPRCGARDQAPALAQGQGLVDAHEIVENFIGHRRDDTIKCYTDLIEKLEQECPRCRNG
jgi:hypothetical protein